MTRPFVKDELEYLDALVSVSGKRVLDIGCGEGDFARRLLAEAGASSVVGIEAEPEKRITAMKAAPMVGLRFETGVAERIPLADGSVDLALMLKSLHHVPMPAMDEALAEVHRVLVDGGILYISEPVYAGEFNEVMRHFHDEGVVRAAAQQAIARATKNGAWELMLEEIFDAALHFRDFNDFYTRMVVRAGMSIPEVVLPVVKERFQRSAREDGARFTRQFRVNAFRKKRP